MQFGLKLTGGDRAFDTNGDGVADVKPSGVDANNNGVDDAYDAYSSPSAFDDQWRYATTCSRLNISRAKQRVVYLRGTIGNRAESFAARARSCSGTSLAGDLARSRSLSKRIGDIFSAC
jgi:hypothetical protein